MKWKRRLLPVLALLCLFTKRTYAEEYPYPDDNTPAVTSSYVYLIDADTDQVIWSQRGEEFMYPASMTKVMTALLALEELSDYSEPITITEEMWAGLIEANASVAGFWPGDTVTVEDLLYGVLLPSGADAVNALAIRIDGSIPAFVERMNRRAQELGMTQTHFTNPTGLHDGDHYSTPRDIEILMKQALQNEMFCEIIGTRTYTTGPLASSPDGVVLNSTSLSIINNGPDSLSVPAFRGGKTGYTPEAGRCLVSHAEQDGMHMILVTGDSYDFGHLMDAATIYNWYFDRYARIPYIEEGTLLGSLTVTDAWRNPVIDVTAPASKVMDLPADAVIEIHTDLPDEILAPVHAGDVLGTVQVTADGQLIYEEQLTAPEDLSYSRIMHGYNVVHRFHTAHPFVFWLLAILLLLVLLYLLLYLQYRIRRTLRRRRRRRRKAQRRAKQRR